jgi:putative tricarboxylic transport membrane protein
MDVVIPRHSMGGASAALFLCCALWTMPGAAQSWKPDKAVELIAPSGAGGGTDLTARLIQRIWQGQRLVDTSVAVTNKPGGAGGVALTYLKGHAGDPHFLQVASAVLLTNHIIGRSAFSHAEFTPIALLNSEYIALAVKAESPITNLAELAARLRKDPGAVSFAVGTSLGGANHITAALVARAANADARKLKTVVFKSSAESAVAALGGHVAVMVTSASLALPHVRSGALRIISLSAPKRVSGALASVPTMKEAGIDAVVDNFRLLIAAGGIAPAAVAYWDDVMAKVVQTEEWRKDLEGHMWENTYLNSRDTRRYLDEQYRELRGALAEVGLAK